LGELPVVAIQLGLCFFFFGFIPKRLDGADDFSIRRPDGRGCKKTPLTLFAQV